LLDARKRRAAFEPQRSDVDGFFAHEDGG
jgi:hypothetical protein